MKTSLFVQKQSGGMFSVQDQAISTGNRFFVGSAETKASDTAGFGRNPDAPFATLKYALSSDVCTASKGDIIYVMPGHTESITHATTAGSSCILDIAGVSVIGIGTGSLIPTFTLSGDVGATMSITAPNCLLRHVKIVSGLAAVAAGITVGALGDGYWIDDCILSDGGTNILELVSGITITAAADGGKITNCKYYTVAAGHNNQGMLIGAVDGCIIENNVVIGDLDVACISIPAAATKLIIRNNVLRNVSTDGVAALAMHTSCEGVCAGNVYCANLNGQVPVTAACTLMAFGGNYGADLHGVSGMIAPAVAAI